MLFAAISAAREIAQRQHRSQLLSAGTDGDGHVLQGRFMALDFASDPLAELAHFGRLGVDGVFVDCPATAREWLAARSAERAEREGGAAEGVDGRGSSVWLPAALRGPGEAASLQAVAASQAQSRRACKVFLTCTERRLLSAEAWPNGSGLSQQKCPLVALLLSSQVRKCAHISLTWTMPARLLQVVLTEPFVHALQSCGARPRWPSCRCWRRCWRSRRRGGSRS